MYKKIYYSTAKDLEDNTIQVEIYLNTTQSVTAKELLLAKNGINITYNNDNNIFKTLMQSNCSITFLTNNILDYLYTSTKNDVICKIYKNNNLNYFGVLTNNVYNSDYETDFDELTVEFVDIIAALDNYKYERTNDKIVSFYTVITNILNYVDTDKVINNIYVQQNYKFNNLTDLLKNLYIQQRNFADEKDEDVNAKDVLLHIIQYLNMSLIQYNDSIYILDYTNLNNSNYTLYNRTSNTVSTVQLSATTKTLQEIGIYSSSGTISMTDTYNTINVIANTLTIDDSIPALFDEDTLTNQNSESNKYYEYEVDDNTYISAYFNSSVWNTKKCRVGNLTQQTEIDEITDKNIENIIDGSFFQKNDYYVTDDGEPSSLNWTDVVTFAASNKDYYYGQKQFKALSAENEYVVYKGGYFILNLEYMYSNYHNIKNTTQDTGVQYSNTKFSSSFDDTKFYCKLKIGDYYWNGEQWLNWNTSYLPVKNLYETSTYYTVYENGETKYYYIAAGSTEKVYVDYETFNKMQAQDRFILIHKNVEGDNIFNTTKQLTNQVSYKMNLVDSQDGVLIALPSRTLYGKLEFELYAPQELGNYANYRTDVSAGDNNTYVRYCHVTDISMIYTNKGQYYNVFTNERYEDDIKYTNVIDENYIKEFDDIEMQVNTFTNTVGSYSYVLYKTTDGYDFVENLTNISTNEQKYIEEFVIDKYSNFYSTPKILYNNCLNYNFNHLFTKLNINSKIFIVNGIEINLLENNANITAIQIQ